MVVVHQGRGSKEVKGEAAVVEQKANAAMMVKAMREKAGVRLAAWAVVSMVLAAGALRCPQTQ